MTARPTVLLVDDDDGVRFTLSEILVELDVEVLEARDGAAALAILGQRDVDLVITDLKMPGIDGMELLRRAKAQRPELKLVMITAHGSETAAVEAMKLGAFDYFPKPFEVDQVAHVVRRATEHVTLRRENARLRAELTLGRHMVYRSRAMARVAEVVERVAPRDVTVLVTGESGTGKELVAEAIVAASARANKPFVRFNCAALPRDVAEAELFGHSTGAFTGAHRARAGLFRQADRGTLFLDEIGELDLSVQSKLLRVIQQGEVRPVGVDVTEKVDVRLIAATHRDLQAEVAAGRFREDLFYRLNVIRVHLPPLRERPEDVEPLIDHFLRKYGVRFGVPNPILSADVRSKLLSREYRGNVRELENAVERLVALSTTSEVVDDLEDAGVTEPARGLGLKERVEAYERGLILAELERTGWNKSETARRLDIARVTLLDKLKKYGLGGPAGHAGDDAEP
ncbi:sigma-54 dependent transcriptional regulator [Myxococcota bacterium]|nr:sigma-54 dependent transcriptional regulator [Myxococcota bacterium]